MGISLKKYYKTFTVLLLYAENSYMSFNGILSIIFHHNYLKEALFLFFLKTAYYACPIDDPIETKRDKIISPGPPEFLQK